VSKEQNEQELYNKVVSLSSEFNTQFLEIGRMLRVLNETNVDEFRRAAKNAGIGLRKAYYLINVIKAFEGYNIPDAILTRVGWTKLTVLQSHVNKHNVRELLAVAEEFTVKNLEAYLRGEDPNPDKHSVLMYLTRDQYELLADALIAHGARRSGRGLVDKEEALMRLLERFRGGDVAIKPEPTRAPA